MSPISTPLAFGFPGTWELLVVAFIGLLLFGKRLPEVGKSLGRSIVEFKKGLKGVEDDIDRAVEADQADMLPPPESDTPDESTTQQTEQQENSTTKQGQPEGTATPSNSSASSD